MIDKAKPRAKAPAKKRLAKKKTTRKVKRAHEDHHARRALIRLMWLRGMQPHDIAKYLVEPTTPEGKPKRSFLVGHADPGGTVRKDLMTIRESERAVLEDEQPHALAAYIGQQKEVFRLALADKSWHAALKASMNVARAQGVDMDEVIHTQGKMEHSGEVKHSVLADMTPGEKNRFLRMVRQAQRDSPN